MELWLLARLLQTRPSPLKMAAILILIWAQDDADFDLDGKENAVGSTGNAESGDVEGSWEVGDEDLELPSDLSAGGEDEDHGYYLPPTRGQPPLQEWATHSQLAIDPGSGLVWIRIPPPPRPDRRCEFRTIQVRLL